MRSSSVRLSLAPEFDVTVVLEYSGKVSRLYQEFEYRPSSLHTVVDNFLLGRYIEPIRVVAFKRGGRRSRDISKEIAEVLLQGALREAIELPKATRAFIEFHLSKAIGAELNLVRLASGAFAPVNL